MIKKIGFCSALSAILLANQSLPSQDQGVAHQVAWQFPALPGLQTATPRAEKWDVLTLEGSNLRSDIPVPGQEDSFPEFTRELVRVRWRDGDPIDLYIVRPAGASRPRPVIYLYGYPREAVRFLDMNFCRTLTRNGLAAVGFSSMLTGQRYHDVPMKEWFVSDLQHSLVGTTHDVQMVLNYLAARGDFDMSGVGIFGEGSGGTIALLAASADSRIKAVDVLNPWGDWPSWLAGSRIIPGPERADYLNTGFQKSVAPLDPVAVLPHLASVQVRLQQTLWEPSDIPVSSRERIASALLPNAALARYKEPGEYYEKVGNNGKMLDWMYANLAPNRAGLAPTPVRNRK